jgi:hypothetical protein
LDRATTTASTIATIATIAAVATAVATMMASAVATSVAATVATAIATVAATVMTKRHHLAVTADKGDSNDREEHRETKNNDTVHPQILQLLTGTVSENYRFCRHDDAVATADGSAPRCDHHCNPLSPSHPKRSLLSKSTGYEGYEGRKG